MNRIGNNPAKGETASDRIARNNALRKVAQESNKSNASAAHNARKNTDGRAVIEIDSENEILLDHENEFAASTISNLLQQNNEKTLKQSQDIPSTSWKMGQMQGNTGPFTGNSSNVQQSNVMLSGRSSNQDDIVATSYNLASRGNEFVGILPAEGIDVDGCSAEDESEDEGFNLHQIPSEHQYFNPNANYLNTGMSKAQNTVWTALGNPAVSSSSMRQPFVQPQPNNMDMCGDCPTFSNGRQQFIPVLTNGGITYQMATNPQDVVYRQFPGNQNYGYGDPGVMYSPTMVYRNLGNLRGMKVINVPQVAEQGQNEMWQPQDDSDEEIIEQDQDDERLSVCSDQPVIEKRKKRKKESKKEKIKRPMNAFMVWAKKTRAKFAQKFNGINNADVSVKLGETWSSMTMEQKQPFFDEANKIKEQHRRDHPDWVYQPKPKRKRTTGSGVTSLFAVTVNTRGNNAVRHINTYKHTNSGLVFQQVTPPANNSGQEQPGVQVMQGPTVPARFSGNNSQQQQQNVSVRVPVQLSQSGNNMVVATPNQISQLQQQGIIPPGVQTLNLGNQQLPVVQVDGNEFQMFDNNNQNVENLMENEAQETTEAEKKTVENEEKNGSVPEESGSPAKSGTEE